MNTIPASNSLMNRSRSLASLVHALAPSPKLLSLAMRMASPTYFARNTLATVPKSTSFCAGDPWGMFVSTVGA